MERLELTEDKVVADKVIATAAVDSGGGVEGGMSEFPSIFQEGGMSKPPNVDDPLLLIRSHVVAKMSFPSGEEFTLTSQNADGSGITEVETSKWPHLFPYEHGFIQRYPTHAEAWISVHSWAAANAKGTGTLVLEWVDSEWPR